MKKLLTILILFCVLPLCAYDKYKVIYKDEQVMITAKCVDGLLFYVWEHVYSSSFEVVQVISPTTGKPMKCEEK